ncbi:type II toxin-antitoxin system Phd/YefM family antitoxin [Crocosphaera sp.]|uniref:type II toxin-antitoxin system Phd/YefM family antitoxin n=1 Tax=Crocosphaera sp. TaxID=2729996 RepID=UPI003F23094E|nr:type II toxin-antitoxin system Phd/YefM family antitoxin [Crocosphaera sp.]
MLDSTHISFLEAQKKLLTLMEQVNESHQPVTITAENNNVVLVSEEDWKSLQETLYLKSIPGMWESIEEGINEPIEDCSDSLPW